MSAVAEAKFTPTAQRLANATGLWFARASGSGPAVAAPGVTPPVGTALGQAAGAGGGPLQAW